MARKNLYNILGVATIAGGIAVFYLRDVLHAIILPCAAIGALVLFGMNVVKRRKNKPVPLADDGLALARQIGVEESRQDDQNVRLGVLGAQHSRDTWRKAETEVDTVLDRCIRLIGARLSAYTAAVFFPTDDGGYKIRRFASHCDCVNHEAVIYPGKGVLGGFIKDGLQQINLHEILSDSTTLFYYTQDVKVRSLLAHPIIAGGIERGIIIADSTEARHFTDADQELLADLALLCGEAVYHAYLSTEKGLRYERLNAMSSIEKYFFEKHDVESVLDKMMEIIPCAVACDRLTISLKDPEGEKAVIRRVLGTGTEKLLNVKYDTKNKTLAGLLFTKNICFWRDFTPDHYELRFFEGEEVTRDMGSFLAVPIGVDECKGTLILESVKKDAFGSANRALLSRLAMSAGLAIEKIQVLEQARALATHDGLTGLYNHRQFQKLLRDEITRSTRYNEPLSMVLCDIDFFKKVNDNHGHPFGDTVLRGVSAALAECVRDGVDIAARYGGEEFALVLVKADLTTAQETAERIRESISNIVFHNSKNEVVKITMSFGVAVWGVHAKDTVELIHKADKALYRAKENGRNRVEVA